MMASKTIKEKFVELQNSKQIPQNTRPKIQRVAEYLRNRENSEKHYSPKFMSIGPIHHGNTNLKLGEKYKLMWAEKYIKNTEQSPEDLYQNIAGKIDEVKDRFDDDILTLTGKSLEGFGSLEEKLSWMLFVDGCSLLYILDKIHAFEEFSSYYEFMNIKVDQLALVMIDVFLLENQLPYEVLKLLWKNNNESELKKQMREFINCIPWGITLLPVESQSENVVPNRKGEAQHSVSIPNESQSETPTHLLDLKRKIIVTTSDSKTKSNEAIKKKWSQKLLKILNCSQKLLRKVKKWSQKFLRKVKKCSEKNSSPVELITYKNIQDLRAVGIRLKASETQSPIDIDFSAGWFAAKLILPKIIVDRTSAASLLNLIAYEMCPDFKNDYRICTFIDFLDSLIDHAEDVKELRSKGILYNSLGSDEEVANLFNIIATDVVSNAETYGEVRNQIHDHYCNKYKTWIALGFHTYFSNPWAIIAFLAAFIALVLTFIQTWFAIIPTC